MGARGALSWPDMLCAEKVGSPPSRLIARYGASDRGFPFPLHDTLRILLAKPSGQISSNAKAAAHIPLRDCATH